MKSLLSRAVLSLLSLALVACGVAKDASTPKATLTTVPMSASAASISDQEFRFLEAPAAAAVVAGVVVQLPSGPARRTVVGTQIGEVRSLGCNWNNVSDNILLAGNIDSAGGGTTWGYSSNSYVPTPLLEALPSDSAAATTNVSVCEDPFQLEYGNNPALGKVSLPSGSGGQPYIKSCSSYRSIRVYSGSACPNRVSAFECVGVMPVALQGEVLTAYTGGAGSAYGNLCSQLVVKSVCAP